MKSIYHIFKKTVICFFKLLRIIDRKYFSSVFQRFFDKLLFPYVDKLPGENYAFLKNQWAPNRTIVGGKVNYSKVVEIPTCDFILTQYDRWKTNYYYRYDLAVRVLALEQMDGKNDFGQDWDDLMQESWTEENWRERFKNLYHSVKQKGYDTSSYVEADRDLRLEDGSHRTAIAYYTGEEFINVRINSFSIYPYYYGWDEINLKRVFSNDQIKVIENRMEKILSDLRYPFTAIIWTPAKRYFDDIIESLNEYDSDNVTVKDWFDLTLTEGELRDFMGAVYYYDDVAESNLDYKQECNIHSSQVKDNHYTIRVLRLYFDNPYYMTKSMSGMPQSRESVLCKENIRSEYSRYIYDYKRDVILHIADNYLQSKFIWQIVNLDRDITELFEQINQSGVPYVSIKLSDDEKKSIIYKYLLHSDIDILTKKENVSRLLQIIDSYCQVHFKEDWAHFKQIQDGDHWHYVVYIKDYPLFTFDIQTNVGGGVLSNPFVEDCLHNRYKKNLFFVLPEQYEVIVRMAEYSKCPSKQKHKDYVMANRELLTDDLLQKAFGDKKDKMLQIILK